MSIVRAFLIGVLAAAGVIVVFVAGPERVALGGSAAILLALAITALFGAGGRGWLRRLARGGLGSLIAALAAVAVLHFSKGRNSWFDWPADSAGGLWLVMLLTTAAIPGGLAAAAGPRRGPALTGGFTLGLAAMLTQHGGPRELGIVVLLAVGTLVGTLVGALVRDRE